MTNRENRKTPARLFGGALDIHVICADPTDLGPEAILQHLQQALCAFRVRLERTAHGQAAQRIIRDLDLERRVSHQLVDDVSERLTLEIQCAVSPREQSIEL